MPPRDIFAEYHAGHDCAPSKCICECGCDVWIGCTALGVGLNELLGGKPPGGNMTIIVDVKNEILGDSEFWRGDESRIAEIRNIPARMTAEQVVADGKPRVCGMWHVRQELPPNDEAHQEPTT